MSAALAAVEAARERPYYEAEQDAAALHGREAVVAAREEGIPSYRAAFITAGAFLALSTDLFIRVAAKTWSTALSRTPFRPPEDGATRTSEEELGGVPATPAGVHPASP